MKAWPRFTRPLPVFLKRLAAPLCVFSFGIVFPIEKSNFTATISIRERAGSAIMIHRWLSSLCPLIRWCLLEEVGKSCT